VYPSCIVRRIASIGGLDRLLHAGDLILRQEVKVACTFSPRKSAIVPQTEPDDEIDLPVWHVHNLLDSTLGFVVARQE
jgi:hypothetical protein